MKKSVAPPLKKPLGFEEICRLLPHRSPFLLVDSILEWEPRCRCVGLKNFSSGERFFHSSSGHVAVPGAFLIEAMAQVAGLLALESFEAPTGFFFLAHIERVRLRRAVEPGDQFLSEATLCSFRPSLFKTCVVARVDGHVVAQAKFSFAHASASAASAAILRDTIHAVQAQG